MKVKITVPAICALLCASLIFSGCSGNGTVPESNGIIQAQQSAAVTTEPGAAESGSSQSQDNPADSEEIYLGDFTAKTLDGGEYTQENIAQYDVVIINFWGTTCPPCINEMPDIAKLQQKLEDENSNIALITFCLDGTSSPDTCEAILNKAGYTGITLVSSDGVLGDLAASVMYIPTTVFFYGDGLAALSLIGGQTDVEGEYMARADAMLKAANE